jgi:FMN phosphatase YigB (HAD superfamily)
MLHVGDDPDADVAGALAAGYGAAWLFGKRSTDGLTSFEELVRRLGV